MSIGKVSPRVIVAAHQPIIRNSMIDFVRALGLDTAPASAKDFHELTELLSGPRNVRMILLCFRLPGLGELRGIRRFVAQHSEWPVLVLCEHVTQNGLNEIIEAGAKGVLTIDTKTSEIERALRVAADGKLYLPIVAEPSSEPSAGLDPPSLFPGQGVAGLTLRQCEVFQGLLRGESNKLIARNLKISPHTVNMHVRSIFNKLEVNSRIELVLAASSRTGPIQETIEDQLQIAG